MKIIFVHGAQVLDGAWWWHRMVEPLGALGLGSLVVELPSCAASEKSQGTMYADARPIPEQYHEARRWYRVKE